VGARPFPFDDPAGVDVMVKLFYEKLVLMSRSDHRVVVEVVELRVVRSRSRDLGVLGVTCRIGRSVIT